MTVEKMEEIGRKSKALKWSDQELKDQISALMQVIAWFKGRGDAEIVLRGLRIELNSFEQMYETRRAIRQANRRAGIS